jgi:phage terminase large subunit-like protein
MLIAISTAGYERGKSVAWEWWQDAERVEADPASNPTFFGKIYGAGPADDWWEPATWYKANPSLGVTIPEKSFKADAMEARSQSAKLNSWARYRLNCWTTADTRFFHPDTWAACSAPPPEPLEGRECFGGLDLASTRDLTAVAFCFGPDADGVYDFDVRCFIPMLTAAEREQKDRVPYLQWIREGWIIGTDGNRCDYEVVEKYIIEYAERHTLRRLAVDNWNAGSTFTHLTQAGIPAVGMSMGLGAMSSPTKLMDTLVAQRKIRHGNNPVLNWCAANCAVRADANGNIAPCKQKSTERIDAVVACVMALSLASTAQIAQTSWEVIEL